MFVLSAIDVIAGFRMMHKLPFSPGGEHKLPTGENGVSSRGPLRYDNHLAEQTISLSLV